MDAESLRALERASRLRASQARGLLKDMRWIEGTAPEALEGIARARQGN